MPTDSERSTIEHMLTVGRGGAIRRLLATGTGEYRDLILDHCLHNKTYDPQCGDTRAGYLYPLIKQPDTCEYFRYEILKALATTTEEGDLNQLFDFAVLFARDGDEAARAAAYACFDQYDLAEPWNYAEYLIAIDGIDGLLHVLDRIGADPASLDSYNVDVYPIRVAEGYCDPEAVRQALAAARDENPNIARFLDRIADYYTPSLALDDIIRSHDHPNPILEARRALSELTWQEFRRRSDTHALAFMWGKTASDEEIASAVPDILAETDIHRQAFFLRIFTKHPFPDDPRLLIDLFESPSLRVSNVVLRALSLIPHPEVRAFFDRLIERPEWANMAVRLLRSNYRDGDHLIMERLLESEADVDELHDLTGSVLDVFKENPVPEAERSLLLIYEKCPCSLCREKSVHMLHDRNQLPEWVVEECAYDENEGLRAAAREWLSAEP